MLKKYFLTAGMVLAFCCNLITSGCNDDDPDNQTTTTTTQQQPPPPPPPTTTTTITDSTSTPTTTTMPNASSASSSISGTLSTTSTEPAATTTSTTEGNIALDKPLPEPANAKQELAFGINTFGMEIYKLIAQANTTSKNLVMSPYSISNCLAMIYAGAKNNTEQQMAGTLHYTLSQQELHETFGNLGADLVTGNNADNSSMYVLKLKIENSGWFQKNYSFLTSYTDILASQHKAELTYVDFINDTENTRQTINQWASDKTQGKIPELIPAGAIHELTRLVVVTAIYFKGTWCTPFYASMTTSRPFHLLDGTDKNVPTMQQQGTFEYADTSMLKAVKMYYFGTLAMVIVAPDSGKFNEVTRQITAGGLYSIMHDMKSTLLKLKMPKFHARTNRKINDDLKTLNMTDVFSCDLADLSGIDANKNPEKLYLDFVIHEAVIDVDEKGTEAAAATAAGVAGTGMNPNEPIDCTIDRPFLFAIYDTNTDAVLFLGSVLDPSEKE